MARISISIKEGKIAEKENDELIIGIDLGTTNSLVAYAIDNKPQIIKKEGDSSLVPSVIYFDENNNIEVGESAKEKLIRNPERTIYSAKRLMGKSYKDLDKVSQYLAYEIIENDEEELIKVKVNDKYFTPIELSSNILRALKENVETLLNRKVQRAVITVPAYFNDAQRQATRDAGKLAGLEVMRIVNEPTAASLAYGIGLDQDTEKTVAVYDLGGGTFDISILSLQGGVFEVLSTNGDTFLGGDDFDQAILGYWIKENNLSISELEDDKSMMQKLRLTAEEAKKELSRYDTFSKRINSVDFKLNKTQFNSLVGPLVDRTIASCKSALKDAELTINEIDEIIMVGGSTRVALVKSSVKEFFGKELNDKINPDEVVALGAAVQADILAGNQKGILLLDITPLSLGIETMGGLMDTIIPRNSKVPAKASRQYTTSKDGQSKIKITVFQGERDLVEHNRKLGEFILSDIPPMPAGLPKVDITFMLDADGVMKVKAKEERSGQETSLQIKSQYGISEEEMAKMLMDSLKHAKADMQIRGLLEARNDANSLLSSLSKFLKDNSFWLSQEQISEIENLATELNDLKEKEDKNKILDFIDQINKVTEPLANEAFSRIVKNKLENPTP